MTSQTDLDQGGTFRQYVKRWLGPSVGWVSSPDDNVVPVTAAGTTTIVQNVTLVTVNVAGAVVIQLPSALSSTQPAVGLPGTYLALPVTIVDIGGHANAFNIRVLPFGTEKIMGQAFYDISSDYGCLTIIPDLVNGGWVQKQ